MPHVRVHLSVDENRVDFKLPRPLGSWLAPAERQEAEPAVG